METAAFLPLDEAEAEAGDRALARRLLDYRKLVVKISAANSSRPTAWFATSSTAVPSYGMQPRPRLRHARARQVPDAVRHRARSLARFRDYAVVVGSAELGFSSAPSDTGAGSSDASTAFGPTAIALYIPIRLRTGVDEKPRGRRRGPQDAQASRTSCWEVTQNRLILPARRRSQRGSHAGRRWFTESEDRPNPPRRWRCCPSSMPPLVPHRRSHAAFLELLGSGDFRRLGGSEASGHSRRVSNRTCRFTTPARRFGSWWRISSKRGCSPLNRSDYLMRASAITPTSETRLRRPGVNGSTASGTS